MVPFFVCIPISTYFPHYAPAGQVIFLPSGEEEQYDYFPCDTESQLLNFIFLGRFLDSGIGIWVGRPKTCNNNLLWTVSEMMSRDEENEFDRRLKSDVVSKKDVHSGNQA